jgi:Glycosyltransferase sugar-binding region containing DXD motif
MIPKILHYCFGLSSDFGGKPWSLIHHVCVKSAVQRIRPSQVFLYCEYEPAGPWWELTRNLIDVQRIQAPREIFGNPLLHAAHRADVVRIERLLSTGGIYLDADVYVHKSFDKLLDNATVLGEERVDGEVVGLCNAVILSEAGAPFLQKWHAAYKTFRSKGHDAYWDEHSVKLPFQLSKDFPGDLTILPPNAFFWPTFKSEDLALIYESAKPLDLTHAYATHLWESPAWERHLEHLTPHRVRAANSNFHYWARPMLEGLSDDYGKPSYAERAAKLARRWRRRFQSKARKFVEAATPGSAAPVR